MTSVMVLFLSVFQWLLLITAVGIILTIILIIMIIPFILIITTTNKTPLKENNIWL